MSEATTTNTQKVFEADEELKSFFLRDATIREHYDAQNQQYEKYVPTLFLLVQKSIDLSSATLARVLAAALARKDRKLAKHLLDNENLYTIVEVRKALNILDSSRKKRALEKKLERLQKQGCKNTQKLGQIKSTINDLSREESIGSVSGSICKFMKAWVKSIEAKQLQYFAMNMPKEPWKELADLCHLHPSDFQLDWFLPYAFGSIAEAPTDSGLSEVAQLEEAVKAKAVTAEEVTDMVRKFKVPYSYLRRKLGGHSTESSDLAAAGSAFFTNELKVEVAKYETLATILWWYEELTGNDKETMNQINKIIEERLKNGEEPSGNRANYGKLCERLLTFHKMNAPFYHLLVPIADKRLREINLPLEPPVAVIGDASSSMDVAIKTANIFGSMLTVLTNAELSYFTGTLVKAPLEPKNVSDVITITSLVRACGCTAPAAALWPYYEQKKVLKFIIMATDEEENTTAHGYKFAGLLKKYREEVYPVQMIFISFLRPKDPGQMATALKALNIPYLQFRMDSQRPDLTKLDELVGMISLHSSSFREQVNECGALLKEKGIAEMIAHIKAAKGNANNNNNNNHQVPQPLS